MVTPVPRPIVMPRLTRDEAALQNDLAGRGRDLSFGDGWTLQDRTSADHTGAGAKRCRIGLTLSGQPVSLLCPQALFSLLVERLAPEADRHPVPPSLLPLCLELSLHQPIETVETACDVRIVVEVVEWAPPPGHDPGEWRALTLEAFGRQWPLELSAQPRTLGILLRAWPRRARPMSGMRLPSTLRLGTTVLPVGALRSLRPGDAVLMEHGGVRTRGTLIVAGTLRAPAELTAQGWRLDTLPARGQEEREGWLGTEDRPEHRALDSRGAVREQAISEEQLPVTLCFDLGRLEMELGNLRKLDTGSVLELQRPTEAPIQLTVGGRCIGSGELVDIDGRLGVRILRILDGD